LSDVGDAIELTYTTAPGATVLMDWIHTPTGAVLQSDVEVPETISNGQHTGLYPVTLVGSLPGTYEAVFTASGAATSKDSYFERFDPISNVAPLATLGEYTALYGALNATQSATCRALLKRASQLVRDSYPGIDGRITAGTVPGDSAGLAVLNMVARVMRNPDGLRSQTIGPISRSFDTDIATGMLTLSSAEAGMLIPPITRTGARGKIGTARVTGGLVPTSPDLGPLMYGPGRH
jgi:hypothetical protein